MNTRVNNTKELIDYEINDEKSEAKILLFGELDHHSVKPIREEIDEKIIYHRPKTVILDLENVSFADSAALGLILGRYTRISEYGGVLSLCGVSKELFKILSLAGTEKIMKIELLKAKGDERQ